ncbi:MAG: hypothetical protein ACTHL8_21625 [Burkholderiaceae bacterium]
MGASAASRELSAVPADPRRAASHVDPLPAIVEAARGLEVPLVVADARTPGTPLLFANAAAARLAGRPADQLEGEPVAVLAGPAAAAAAQAAVASGLLACLAGRARPVVLGAETGAAAEIVSFAPVAGPGGAPSYGICAALGRANDDGAARATAVERAQAQLAEVARALEWLMRESRAAAQIDEAGRDATLLAHDAVRDAGTAHG